MKRRTVQLVWIGILLSSYAAVLTSVRAQSINGQIEGTVVDQVGAGIPHASIIVTNIETGATRSASTDGSGFYRIPLLAIGQYRVIAEAHSFTRMIHDRVTVTTGQAATLDLQLQPGEILETVTVSADIPIADTGKTDLGRVMNTREVHNIPLPTRNPLNFVPLQANVTGHPNRGNLYPQLNVNGFLRRTYWQVDGNTNTRGEIAGARTMLISETYVNEMHLLTPGFAAEFGNTTGMIVNVVTPSGTNDLHGSAMFRFSRPLFYARPFFYSGATLPDSFLNNVAVAVGGPIVKDRWHFYFGHERSRREDNTSRGRQVNILEANSRALIEAGLPASIFLASIPGGENTALYIFRTDLQLNGSNRLTARFNNGRTHIENGIGGFNTWERSLDTKTVDHSFGAQLASFSQSRVNEARFQYVRGRTSSVRNENSGTGISVNIDDIANFGSPGSGTKTISKDAQLQDNFTWIRGEHAIKFGGGFIAKSGFDRASTSAVFTFRSISDWQNARSGALPYGYTRYQQTFGDPETTFSATYWNLFAQDEWKATRRLKLNFGLRYDIYIVPDPDPTSPYPASRKFNIDRNNFAPRLGIVYELREGRRPTILRAGAGIYFEPPWTDAYTRSLRDDGDPRFFTLQFLGTNGGTRSADPQAPAFPGTFSGTQPQGLTVTRPDLTTIAPDFENMYALHSNVQIEQGLTEDLSLTVGYVHSGGRHIPVYRSVNVYNPVGYLADGRPIFGPERLDRRFNVIQEVESGGSSQYDALNLQFTQRFSRGIQSSISYTLARAVDDAPEQDVAYDSGARVLRSVADPTNRSFDKGHSYGDQRHTFVWSMVVRPTVSLSDEVLRRLLNNNQLGLIARASSGERFNIRTQEDLNKDGLFGPDRPVGVKRNSGKTPAQFNVDLRYSRFISFTERYRLEVFGEFQNLFNTNNIVSYNVTTVPVNPATGEMLGPMPDFSAGGSKSLEARQVQVGMKFIF